MTWILTILALAVPTAAILLVRSDPAEAQRVLAAVPVLAAIRLGLLVTSTSVLGTLSVPVAVVLIVLLAELAYGLLKGRMRPLLGLGMLTAITAVLFVAMVGPQALRGEELAWTAACLLTFLAVLGAAGGREARARH